MVLLKIFTLWILCLTPLLGAFQDLEDEVQDFVLETKKIEVPEFPYAFNPSIVLWQGHLLMSFREIGDPQEVAPLPSGGDSRIGLVLLDEQFNPIGPPQILSLKSAKINAMQSEDARLIVVGNHLYLIYSGNGNHIIEDEGFRMYAAELAFDGTHFSILKNECLSQFEGRNKNKREKNWVPFAYDDELYLAYSIKPHKILKPLLDGSKTCLSICSSMPSIVWEWGELRGGTPALPIDNDYYLAFFHSAKAAATEHSQGQEIPHYFIGAYLFSREAPFAIKQISPEPICGHGFYRGCSYIPYWHPVQVVFPCGFVFDEQFIWVAYGRQDHEMWVVKLDRQGLLESMIQVSTLKK